VLVLLPPSESKSAPAHRGRPVDLQRLSFPELTDLRQRVLEALITTSARPDARTLLGVGASLADEVARNTTLAAIPARPAAQVYTGVLYDALGWDSLSPAGRRRAQRRVIICSALWGALRPGDRIPPYRLSMDGELPGLGGLARLWRSELPAALTGAAGRGSVLVDCRSGSYAAAAPATALPAAVAARTVAVRVLREVAGRRSVVSHLAKHTRGEVARFLVESADDPRTPADLADLVGTRWPVELGVPARAGAGPILDVVLRDDAVLTG